MSMLSKAFHTLRVWAGLADASESHLTPDHGWLLLPRLLFTRRAGSAWMTAVAPAGVGVDERRFQRRWIHNDQ